VDDGAPDQFAVDIAPVQSHFRAISAIRGPAVPPGPVSRPDGAVGRSALWILWTTHPPASMTARRQDVAV